MAAILLADDDTTLRTAFRKVLERDGHSVTEAADGDEALAAFTRARPDLVMIDVYMPHTDGIECVIRLRQLDPDVPIVVMSGGGFKSSTDVLDLARRIGASATIGKPAEVAEIRATVRQALGG